MKNMFPFSAIVGQEEMKRGIILTAIDPTIGGILVFGDRGTGKSTAVRALASLLPLIKVVKGCPYNCANLSDACSNCSQISKKRLVSVPIPVIDLPLGATEDRVVGALDLEAALVDGRKTLLSVTIFFLRFLPFVVVHLPSSFVFVSHYFYVLFQ